MRQKDDPLFGKVLERLRIASLTESDIETLKTRVVVPNKPGSSFSDSIAHYLHSLKTTKPMAIALAPTNEKVDAINFSMLQLEGITPTTFIASDTGMSKKTGKYKLKAPVSVKISKTGGLPQALVIGVGARVMLRKNLDVDEGLVNGSMGTVHSLPTTTDDPIRVLFDGDTKPVPIRTTEATFDHGGIKITRQQYPLVLAYCVTIHKAQGITASAIVTAINWGCSDTGMVYVALSRVRSLCDLHLLEFDPSAIACRTDVYKAYKGLQSDALVLGDEEPIPPLKPCNQMPKQFLELRKSKLKKFRIRNLVQKTKKSDILFAQQYQDRLSQQNQPDQNPPDANAQCLKSQDSQVPRVLRMKNENGNLSFCTSVAQCFYSAPTLREELASIDCSFLSFGEVRVVSAILDLLQKKPGEKHDCDELREAVVRCHIDKCQDCPKSAAVCDRCINLLSFSANQTNDAAIFLELLITSLPDVLRNQFCLRQQIHSTCSNCKASWTQPPGPERVFLDLDTTLDEKETWPNLLKRHLDAEILAHCPFCADIELVRSRSTLIFSPEHRFILTKLSLGSRLPGQNFKRYHNRSLTGISTKQTLIGDSNYHVTSAIFHCGICPDEGKYCSYHKHNDGWAVINDFDNFPLPDIKKNFARSLRHQNYLAYILFFEREKSAITITAPKTTTIRDVTVVQGPGPGNTPVYTMPIAGPSDSGFFKNQLLPPSPSKRRRFADQHCSEIEFPFIKFENDTLTQCYANSAANCIATLQFLELPLRTFLATSPSPLLAELVSSLLEIFEFGPRELYTTRRLCSALTALLVSKCQTPGCSKSMENTEDCPNCEIYLEYSSPKQCDPHEFITYILTNLPIEIQNLFMCWIREEVTCPKPKGEYATYVRPTNQPILVLNVPTSNTTTSWAQLISGFNTTSMAEFHCQLCSTPGQVPHAVRETIDFHPDLRYLIMNLSPIQHVRGTLFRRLKKRQITDVDPRLFPVGPKNFKANAMILHSGQDVKSGHYISSRQFTDQWVIINDLNPAFKTITPNYQPQAVHDVFQTNFRFGHFLGTLFFAEVIDAEETNINSPGALYHKVPCPRSLSPSPMRSPPLLDPFTPKWFSVKHISDGAITKPTLSSEDGRKLFNSLVASNIVKRSKIILSISITAQWLSMFYDDHSTYSAPLPPNHIVGIYRHKYWSSFIGLRIQTQAGATLQVFRAGNTADEFFKALNRFQPNPPIEEAISAAAQLMATPPYPPRDSAMPTHSPQAATPSAPPISTPTTVPASRSISRKPSILWGINISLLPLDIIADLWGESTAGLKKHMEEALNGPRALYSCGPDALLDLCYYTFLLPIVTEILVRRCATKSFNPNCVCSFCAPMRPFFKALLKYAHSRSQMTKNEDLLRPNNQLWDMMLRDRTMGRGLHPKGTVNAMIQSIPEEFLDEASVIKSPENLFLGIYRKCGCPMCPEGPSHEELLLPINLVGPSETDFLPLFANALANCPGECKVHNMKYSFQTLGFGRFIIVELCIRDSQRHLPSMLPESFSIRGNTFLLNGFIKNPGGHFLAVIKDGQDYLVLDDLVGEERNLYRTPNLMDILQTYKSGPLLRGVCLLVYELTS